MPVDDRTPELNLPMPSPVNLLEDDVLRLRDFAESVDLALSLRPTLGAVTALLAAAIGDLASVGYVDGSVAGRVPTARTVTAGSGMAGGGSLSGDITLSLSAGSIASLAKADTAVQPARTIFTAAGLEGGGNLGANRTIAPVWSSEAEAAAAASANTILSPLRGGQLVAALRPFSSQALAEGRTNNASVMTPLRTAQQMEANPPGIPVVGKTSAYTLAATDNGRTISTSAPVTVPSTLPAGTTICIFNNSGSSQTITQGAGLTMYWAQDASTGNRLLGPRGLATISVMASGVAVIVGAGMA
jgi:hypothetical protein